MNIQRIEYVIKQIVQSKNYKDFTTLLSIEDRKKFINFLLSETEEAENFLDKYPINNFIENFFTEEEADNIYNMEFNELSEGFKSILICNLNTNLAKEAIKKYMPEMFIISLVLKKIPLIEEKIEFIKKYLPNLTDDEKKYVLALSLEDDNLKLQYIQNLSADYTKTDVIIGMKDDNLKLKCLNILTNDYDKAQVIKSLKDDNLKLQYLNIILDDCNKSQIIESLKDDSIKLQYLNIFIDDYDKTQVIKSLNDDSIKLQYLSILTDDYNEAQVIKSLKDDNLKLQYLNILINDHNKEYVIKSIKDLKNRIKSLIYLNNITDYFIHADWLDKVENTNDDINKEIIKKISLENNLNYDNLLKLFLKLGYGIRTLGNNLEKIVNLKEDEFDKIMQIIDTLKSSKLTMDDVYNFLPTFYEREFRINNRGHLLIFSRLQDLILNKDRESIIRILFEINKIIDINNILKENNINSSTFVSNLLDNSNDESLLNVLHKITNSYLTKIRNLYVLERTKNAENELNLDFDYDKNYLISNLFKYDIKYIYEFINREINKDKLDDDKKELLNNKYLFIECLKFRKDKENYSKEEFPKIKSKLKLLNGILNTLYEDKKLDFLGDKKDINSKIILKPKEVIANSFFIKLFNELDIDLIKNKLINNSEVYEKLLNIIKKYKFMNWSDTFLNLLEKADLSFNEGDIASFINYFYSFYPKLEEKKRNNLINNISLSNILDEVRTYGSSSVKYNYLLGKEDSNLIISNPTPNSSGLKVEERLREIPLKTLIQFERKYITIPPMDSDISLKNGKKIHVDIGDITSAINLTYGERTGACMRIGGAGSSLFDFCLENENGFHVKFSNPITGNFISRVSGFRNGNTIFLNQLRYSLDENISNSDLIDAVSIVARQIVESTKDSNYPIKNVIISDGYVMNGRGSDKTTLNVLNVKEGYNHFYSDVSNTNAIYLEKNAEIELGPEKSERYDILRKKVKCFDNLKEINEQIQKFNLINGLLKGQALGEISLIDENTIMNINELYVGEDFLVAVDINHNILWKHILERDSYFTLKANEEINILLNYLNEKSIVNEGGKSR